jgi:predicted dehydrogenase
MRMTSFVTIRVPLAVWLVGAWFLISTYSGSAAGTGPLRICIAGLVHGHAGGFLEAALKRSDVKIVGIAEPDTAVSGEYMRRFRFGSDVMYRSAEEMLGKVRPDAVALFSSTFDHRPLVECCSRHGVHVMMEKPLAASLRDAQAIAKAAGEGHITVLVNYETSWYPDTRDVYRIVHQGGLGVIRKMVAHDGHRGPKEIGVGPEFLSWLTDPVLDGGGALMDFGCYGANLFTYVMDNQRPLAVTAVTQQLKPDIYPRVDDEATIILTYPHAQGIIQASWNWPAGRKDLEVYGATASVRTVGRDIIRLRNGDDPEVERTSPPIGTPEDDPISYLAAVVRGKIVPSGLSSLENNLVVNEILEAARRSAMTGRTIRFPLDPAER